jgi:hypothetical protein
MPAKRRPAPINKPRQISEREAQRREAQRELSLDQLLFTRAQSAHLLATSIMTVRRLEAAGRLSVVRLQSKRGPVLHPRADVFALAGIEEAR